MDYLASCYSCQAELDLGCSLFCVIPVHNPASQHRLKPPPLLLLLGETRVGDTILSYTLLHKKKRAEEVTRSSRVEQDEHLTSDGLGNGSRSLGGGSPGEKV